MDCYVQIPRDTYDNLVVTLQKWTSVYSEPMARVLRSHLRHAAKGAGAFADSSDPSVIAGTFRRALDGLDRAKVTASYARLDLRCLETEEVEALETVAESVVTLKPQHMRVLKRISEEFRRFLDLPAMVRIALASED